MSIERDAATADETLDQISDTLMNSMTLTPASDDYLLFFNAQIGIGASTSETTTFSVYVGGVQIAHTERELTEDASVTDNDVTIAVSCKVSPNGSQAVEIRYRAIDALTSYIARNRELNLFPIGDGTDYEQSGTSDQTTSTTYATLDSMAVTPVADDYLLVFTASGDGSGAGDEMAYRVSVGGTIVAHTVRQSLQEQSSNEDEVGILIACEINPTG